MQTDAPTKAPVPSPPTEGERERKTRRTAPIHCTEVEEVVRGGFARATLEIVEVGRPLPHRVWSADHSLSCADNDELMFLPLSAYPFFSSHRGYNIPPPIKRGVTPRYPDARVMGLGKLLRKDGHTQRFLFALRPGARARAWWDLQRSQGYGSAYTQTWSPTKGELVKSTWDRVEEAQLAQEGITYIRPEQTELWREATKLLREQERSRADVFVRGTALPRGPSPTFAAKGATMVSPSQ